MKDGLGLVIGVVLFGLWSRLSWVGLDWVGVSIGVGPDCKLWFGLRLRLPNGVRFRDGFGLHLWLDCS